MWLIHRLPAGALLEVLLLLIVGVVVAASLLLSSAALLLLNAMIALSLLLRIQERE